jgi:hypothetical protein
VATRDVDKIKFIKSLLSSLFQREDLYYAPLWQRGAGKISLKSIIDLLLKGYHGKDISIGR